jgi:hypothetical protein
MQSDFCVFILTNGRPDSVVTTPTLRGSGYTGKIFYVVDTDDKAGPRYVEKYGGDVLFFSKSEIAKTFDEGDNFSDRRAIIYARNACWDLAARYGYKYFVQLDDDYTRFSYRFDKDGFYSDKQMLSLDITFSEIVKYLERTSFASIALAQGGDHLGGGAGSYARKISTKRKAMNTFFCATDRSFQFVGRVNEDVNTYTCEQRKGLSFLTILGASIVQKQTQSNAGGMTDLYKDSGTYVKSFYSMMYCPSGVIISEMGEKHRRLHHRVNWNACAPKIIREVHRKTKRS